ncbi:S1C family serine protease [Oceanobacillus alkalisoli]|uniref:S1C family serine protease n=1 Tax=Oceanobacillus alkalisoli TaxID=2925113 RepID=UPI001EE4B68D|nr:trypsin-like peptidase domain-containing protein [Oceanobacillus alkalisoli]MCG5104805.1 trypsin-like peptidase domain-containing protein [Oceanobacillus alkalisoli]
MDYEDKRSNHSQESDEQHSNTVPENEDVQENRALSENTSEEISDLTYHSPHGNVQEEQPSQEQMPLAKNSGKTTKKWSGWSALVGGIVGGVVAAAVVAVLFVTNIIPLDGITETSPVTQNQSSETPAIIDTFSSEDATSSTSIQEVSEAVVGVVNLQQRNIWAGSEEAGTGSGIIYKKEDGKAYVVTNQHVVDGAENVEIVLNDEERVPATVLGEDTLMDLAVLEVDGELIDTVATFGTSENLAIGETVLAIGNPLGLEFANTVTKGIISGLNRSVPVDTNSDGQPDWVTEVLQTDAAINPGNSGGALVNTDGEVIGINSMKIAQSAVEGIGFAIPTDTALPIIEQLETEGGVTRPLIGISTAALYQVPPEYRNQIELPDDIEGGMVIANVEPRSPADEAGLEQYDVITKINDEPVTSILELRKYLYSDTAVGEAIKIEYIRDGKVETTELVLEQLDDHAA